MTNPSAFEQNRIMALHRFGLLDTPPEKIFDGITLAIANICDTPIALISLVDHDRQWFKSAYGLQAKETARDFAFCSHAIDKPQELMIVEDAMLDDRFRRNPLVANDPQIRFYAGKPIISEDGYPLGTLCVIDRKPRRLKSYQYNSLAALSETISAILNERERMKTTAIDKGTIEEIVRERAIRYQHLYESAEGILHGILSPLSNPAAIVSADGTIVAVNKKWPQFQSNTNYANNIGVGSNFRDIRRQIEGPIQEKGSQVIKGLEEVLSGILPCYRITYRFCNIEYTMTAEPIMKSHANGVLVQHITGHLESSESARK